MVLRSGTLAPTFGNDSEVIKTVYDFSTDGGTAGTFVMTAGAESACMVKLLAIKVDTAVTSDGSATLIVGTSADDNAFLASEAKTSFALGAVVLPDVSGFIKLAADATLDVTVEVAALTAGKLTFVWEVMKF
jgi:hypothetical protein